MRDLREDFVNDGALQSTLRELKGLAASRNLWLTFAAVVLLFAFTGPFGTLEQLPFLPRLAYWLILHAGAWSAALIFSVLGDVLLKNRIGSMLARMMIGSIIAAIPIGIIIQFVQFAWFARVPTASGLAAEMLFAAPLCVIFCVITYMTMSAERVSEALAREMPDAPPSATVPSPADAAEPAPLLQRLRPENRGQLRHLAVEDHYVSVSTSRGRELILLRFSDALRETGEVAGLQVHRSHWVADDFVAALNRIDGRLTLTLDDGTAIPVSRPYAAAVRARFG
jgi:DNA-binding LytR/AlgR family response regulator